MLKEGESGHCSYFVLVLFSVINRWKMSESKSSPYPWIQDEEAAATGDEDSCSVFDIARTKHASAERLKRWRVS